MLNGIDISCDQGTIDWDALKSSNRVAWVHAKAGEGITYRDENFRSYHDEAKRVALPFGAYWFFRGNDDGEQQAQAFLETIDGYQGTVLPMVDCESGGDGGVDKQTYLNNLGQFLEKVDATLNGKRCIIYVGYSFWRDTLGGYSGFSGHALWIAEYNSATRPDISGTGWNDWTIWQWSDGGGLGKMPGISTDVDRDTLNGDELEIILR